MRRTFPVLLAVAVLGAGCTSVTPPTPTPMRVVDVGATTIATQGMRRTAPPAIAQTTTTPLLAVDRPPAPTPVARWTATPESRVVVLTGAAPSESPILTQRAVAPQSTATAISRTRDERLDTLDRESHATSTAVSLARDGDPRHPLSGDQPVLLPNTRWRVLSARRNPTGAVVVVEVENLASSPRRIEAFEAVDAQGRRFKPAGGVAEAAGLPHPTTSSVSLNPNVPVQFSEVFPLPSDATGLMIHLSGNPDGLFASGTERAYVSIERGR